MKNKNIKITSTRRKFLSNITKAAAIGTSINTIPFFKINIANALSLPNFPQNINVYLEKFENWSGELKAKALWTCAPKNSDEIITIINWAKKNNFKVRPKGKQHNWSPLTLANNSDLTSNIILVDTKLYLNNVTIDKFHYPFHVTAQTGITMEALATQLEEYDLGFSCLPAPGELTLGGVLAINGHGSAVSLVDEDSHSSHHNYGSLSNQIDSLTAIVWDAASDQYILKKFLRSHPQCQAFLVHLGRAFITEVTLRVEKNQRIRCQSIIGIPAAEIFGDPLTSKFNFSHFINKSGRAEIIWYPFTDKPWLKVWSITNEKKPEYSREVNNPYNYPFSDNISENMSKMIQSIVAGHTGITPQFGKLMYYVTAAGLEYSNSFDLWGWSKNLLLYIRPSTMKVTANGYVVITKRENIQKVLNDLYKQYNYLIDKYRAQSKYPINGPLEIRVTGLDNARNLTDTSPILSSIHKVDSHPDWNVGIWINVLTLPGTPFANHFYTELEEWIYTNYCEPYATVRVEWSKGWAYNQSSAWVNKNMIRNIISTSFKNKDDDNSDWDRAASILNENDPHRVFSSPLIDSLNI
ncbi:cholesterol oxidase substrate-binding domain-containing protein [Fluviispira sanaruensis]|uniref:FAD-binding protein n=1 Tax=Fluviispira sanaruensis TaxID=2493639 RepID=A0A4P2VTX9_FLUSA|nr:cholesterol oxidase substrate-binding domain-containing protein [Fluviispira sanaruensis]BBH52342.1 FAD-binding protein [Fluviispira sanaruensis]